MSERIPIRFGALCAPLSYQLAGRLDDKTLELFDAHADAITRLDVHGLLTASEVTKVRQRLVKDIAKRLEVKK